MGTRGGTGRGEFGLLGCRNLKIENLNVIPAARPAMPGDRSVSTRKPAAMAGSTIERLAQPANRIAGEERRRSQRVLLRVRAQIHVAVEGKATTFDVETLNVNPHGALVIMGQSLVPGTRLVLENNTTRERVACKVARQPRESSEGFQVPLEFDSPAPQFWRIDFPPVDWRAEE
jgi:PilZ domain